MKYLLYIIIGIILLFNVYKFGQNSIKPSIIEKVDTITRIDTIVAYKPIHDTIYLTEYIIDTLYATDSSKVEVNIPIETKIYKDSTYECKISGYKANLDEIKVFPKEVTIYKEKTLEIKNKPHFQWGIQGGVGYGMINKKPDVYIGIGLSYNF